MAAPELLPPVTPGEILREEFMVPLGLSARRLAQALGVPTNRVTAILKGTRSVTADTALRLGQCFGATPQFWLNLQNLHDLELVQRSAGAEIADVVKPLVQPSAQPAGGHAFRAR